MDELIHEGTEGSTQIYLNPSDWEVMQKAGVSTPPDDYELWFYTSDSIDPGKVGLVPNPDRPKEAMEELSEYLEHLIEASHAKVKAIETAKLTRL